MDPFAQALVNSVVVEGDSVLDVACGTGIATRAAAEIAGAHAAVVGSDINRPMLDVAAEFSVGSGDGIAWREASTLDLPFDDGEFDRVICQQGVQFLPDPGRGLSEMARVARVGGTVAVTVWSPLGDSPYFEAMHSMLMRYCDAEPLDVAWASETSQVAQWFAEGGLSDVSVDRRVERIALPPLDAFVPAHMKATPWAQAFGELSPSRALAAVSDMQHHLSSWKTAAGLNVPFSSYLATAPI
ncbi:unnamed protein product [marine sediment metagenome]|uniref:Methyltransferase type 11 domain-containing protein n=1 Tax=marine sediment metagenome TaxID=412755 RepID=X0Z1L3_9ZZZZ